MTMADGDPFLKRFSCCVIKHLKNFVCDHHTALMTVAVVAVGFKARRTFKASANRQKWDSAGKDVVVLHAGGPGKTILNASPFVMKLDMYLTMAGIPFKHDSRQPFGPKGKMPWITLNGEDMADSQMIIDHLNKKFNQDFNSSLTPEQKVVARSMRLMMEEHLLWGIAWWRFVADYDYNFMKYNNVPWMAGPILRMGFVRRRVQDVLYKQGVGRHSEQQIIDTMTKDIEALSVYLGDKKFIMGEEPSELDCTTFGFLSMILWGLQGNPWIKPIEENYPNILAYCDRVKERFYPNWQQRLLNKQR